MTFLPDMVKSSVRFIPGGSAVAGPVLVGGALIVGAGARAAAKIPPEHVGLRFHNSRARAVKEQEMVFSTKRAGEFYGLVRPGWCAVMPGAHNIEIISTQNRNTNLPNFMIMSTLDRQHEINAEITWGVVREFDQDGKHILYEEEYPKLVHKALMAAHNIEEMAQGIGAICTDSLRPILQQRARPDLAETAVVEAELASSCGEELLMTYGAEVRRLSIMSSSYTAPDVLIYGLAHPPAVGHPPGVNLEST